MVLNEQQLTAYFERIGLRYADYKDRPLDSCFLGELMTAHARTMPFENLDLLTGTLLSLRSEDLYDKIVLRHRGGNCFELNGLCGVFLRSLGFGVSDYFSRFFSRCRRSNSHAPPSPAKGRSKRRTVSLGYWHWTTLSQSSAANRRRIIAKRRRSNLSLSEGTVLWLGFI